MENNSGQPIINSIPVTHPRNNTNIPILVTEADSTGDENSKRIARKLFFENNIPPSKQYLNGNGTTGPLNFVVGGDDEPDEPDVVSSRRGFEDGAGAPPRRGLLDDLGTVMGQSGTHFTVTPI